MLVTVSPPAKRLDEKPASADGGTVPVFLDQAGGVLAGIAGQLTGPELEKLMHISPKLGGVLNAERFSDFGSGKGEKQAIEMFAGDTYAGLEASSLDDDELAYAQSHLCILSGLYACCVRRTALRRIGWKWGGRAWRTHAARTSMLSGGGSHCAGTECAGASHRCGCAGELCLGRILLGR